MSARFFTHLGFLLTALGLTFYWTRNPTLSVYTLQVIGVLILLYFANHYFGRKNDLSFALDGLIFAMVTLLLVSQTGGLGSSLFFLLYILLFGLALLFTPLAALFFSLALIFFFVGEAKSLNDFIQIGSLLLITPLALFFGRQYLRVLEEEEKIEILQKQKSELAEEVVQQEEDTLLWLSLAFRQHITTILDNSSNLIADLSRLSIVQKERLQTIHESAKRLLKLGDKLKAKIEE